jgi:hypothetical protein
VLNRSPDVVVRIGVHWIQIATIGIEQVCERPVQTPFFHDESELGACSLNVVSAGQFQGCMPVIVQTPLALLLQAFEPVDGLSAVLLHARQGIQVEDPGFAASSVYLKGEKRIVDGCVHGCSFRSGNTQQRGRLRAMARTGGILKGFPVRVIRNMSTTRDGIHNFSLRLIATGWDFRAQYTRVGEQLRIWKDDHHQPEAL